MPNAIGQEGPQLRARRRASATQLLEQGIILEDTKRGRAPAKEIALKTPYQGRACRRPQAGSAADPRFNAHLHGRQLRLPTASRSRTASSARDEPGYCLRALREPHQRRARRADDGVRKRLRLAGLLLGHVGVADGAAVGAAGPAEAHRGGRALYGATVKLLMNVMEPFGCACALSISATWTAVGAAVAEARPGAS